MDSGLLLDTCAALWASQADKLAPRTRELMDEAAAHGALYVSPITAWEVGILVSRGRVALQHDPQTWFERVLQAGARLAPLTPAILVASSFLPEAGLRDPADRILAATARAENLRLLTRDRPLLAYAEAGWMRAEGC